MANSKAPSGRRLVIVESPHKARTIAGYLGPGFEVEASVGHIRDLPQPSELPPDMKKGPFGKFAVDVDNGFEAFYVVDADKRKKVSELKRALRDADELFLATDEDREGEAIAWHLLQVLEPKVPVRRMVFHEITREAIQRALLDTRDLDERLVDAQETRRILDRLYGYEVSPVLWRKIGNGLSAGRVQSVATRLVVERERERMAFRAASYWDVTGTFAPQNGGDDQSATAFPARLVALDGARVATGRDFGDDGILRGSGAKGSSVIHLDEATAQLIASAVMVEFTASVLAVHDALGSSGLALPAGSARPRASSDMRRVSPVAALRSRRSPRPLPVKSAIFSARKPAGMVPAERFAQVRAGVAIKARTRLAGST